MRVPWWQQHHDECVCVPNTVAWPHWEKHSGNPTARRFLCLLSSYSPPFWSDGGMTDQGTVGFSRCPRSCVVLPLTRAVLHRKSLCLLKADFGVGLQGSFFPLLQASGSPAQGPVQRCPQEGCSRTQQDHVLAVL